ncbi:ion channel [Brevundimonas subvibrioides]|uniref:Ion transport 2 domain protein n=1 Tax=Brevundimonas subvibrioides (strain ATCC 15264 / DSM 4735 / LMG 14903 / NBRC 16000 / CB 81) TaxID=633149 RepID=D9QMH2_BRESC|nr:ion channel [Brevundimonas subvibrioides]ADL00142.1 Ion transport 2 domain protein [Brevundimonas subvibrioides ATCC 15264]
MFAELAIATVMVLITVVLHGGGLLILGRLMEWRERSTGQSRVSPLSFEGALVAVLSALGLLVLHGLEIWLYAFLYRGIGAVEPMRDAVYFSTIAYASIGFSDAAMAPEWKLLGALEGINGALLLGWSVAFFVTLMTRFLPARHHGH